MHHSELQLNFVLLLLIYWYQFQWGKVAARRFINPHRFSCAWCWWDTTTHVHAVPAPLWHHLGRSWTAHCHVGCLYQEFSAQ